MMELERKPTLLLADDDPTNLDVIIHILEMAEEEYIYSVVSNGKEMVEKALEVHPDLVISDWEMPLMSGLEAIAELKKHESTKNIPVIMCTGVMITPENLQQALQAGAVDYIRKPIEAPELQARVRSMLKLSDSFRQIKRQKEELEAMNELKSRLISVVSHDVRSPLNSFKGMLTLFENELLTPHEIKDLTTQLSFQINNISDFLENLLNWTKNQLIDSSPHQKSFPIAQTIASTTQLLEQSANEKSIAINLEVDENLSVFADEEMLKIVLRNLISNAIKFCMKEDEILISTNQKKGAIRVTIKDTGVGISNENLKKLFGAEHLSTKGTKDEMGTGLGLLLSKQLIEFNNGLIGAKSEEGKGSTFWFELPTN